MRSATELLRKYAADGAAPGQPQVKYNLKKVPLKGERVWGYGDVDDTYIDNWWSEYDKANAGRPDKLNRRDVEWQQRQIENKYKEQVDANRGMKHRWWNPLSWTGAADNGAVNAKWLASEAARPVAGGAQGVSELDDRIRNRTLFSNERQQEYRQVDRRNTFAAHVTGQVLDAATKGHRRGHRRPRVDIRKAVCRRLWRGRSAQGREKPASGWLGSARARGWRMASRR